jgi:hypothetical protein
VSARDDRPDGRRRTAEQQRSQESRVAGRNEPSTATTGQTAIERWLELTDRALKKQRENEEQQEDEASSAA